MLLSRFCEFRHIVLRQQQQQQRRQQPSWIITRYGFRSGQKNYLIAESHLRHCKLVAFRRKYSSHFFVGEFSVLLNIWNIWQQKFKRSVWFYQRFGSQFIIIYSIFSHYVLPKCPNYKMWWHQNRWHQSKQPKRPKQPKLAQILGGSSPEGYFQGVRL